MQRVSEWESVVLCEAAPARRAGAAYLPFAIKNLLNGRGVLAAAQPPVGWPPLRGRAHPLFTSIRKALASKWYKPLSKILRRSDPTQGRMAEANSGVPRKEANEGFYLRSVACPALSK